MSTVCKFRISKEKDTEGDDRSNSRVTYRDKISHSRDRHFFVMNEDCECFQTWDGILFNIRKFVKDEDI